MQKMPGHQLRAIYIYGAVQVTAQAVQTALELEIDVAYFSPAGRFLGFAAGAACQRGGCAAGAVSML